MKMFTLGVILARAGSKGLPDKCVRSLWGRPVIDYTLDHALGSRRLNALVLSTDSSAAAQIAKARGVEVFDRPAELATDRAPTDAALRHAVEAWEARNRRSVDAVVMLYGNIPLRPARAIDDAVDQLQRSGCSSVRTVVPVGKHHPDWMFRLDGDRMRPVRENGAYRRQDLEPLFQPDGAIYVVTRAALFAAAAEPADGQAFLGDDRRALVLREEDTVDIDGPADLCRAEALLRMRSVRNTPLGADAEITSPQVMIGARLIAASESPYVIAEAGVNHNGDVDEALRLVDAAKAAGADAVKFQVFRATAIAAPSAPMAAYQKNGDGVDDSQQSMLSKLELSNAEFQRIAAHARDLGIEFLATPFSVSDVARLALLTPRAVKIASTDLNNTPLLERASALSVPLIVSTGAATEAEISAAINRFSGLAAASRLILLHCVSCYPAPLESINLSAIGTLAQRAGVPIGFSDHTTATHTGALAVMAGACVLEKHFTLDRNAHGPDHAMSLTPAKLREYIAQARAARIARGSGRLGMHAIEQEVRAVARKSVVAASDLPAGAVLAPENVDFKRPGGGIAPDASPVLFGRRLRVPVPRDAMISWDMVE